MLDCCDNLKSLAPDIAGLHILSFKHAKHARSLISGAAGLKKLLKRHAAGETLAVLDSKLGSIVKEKMGIDCVYKYAPPPASLDNPWSFWFEERYHIHALNCV